MKHAPAPCSYVLKFATAMVLALACYELVESESIPTRSLLSLPRLDMALPLLLILALPNISYNLIINHSRHYIRFVAKVSDKHPVDFTYDWVKVNKFLQFSAYLVWYWLVIDMPLAERLAEIATLKRMTFAHLACGTYIFVLGLVLYFSVWAKLGVNGVCYGFKLGRPIKWVTGFPFNLGLRHPLYVGFTFIIMGLAVILIDRASAENGILLLSLVWSSYNISTGRTEEFSDESGKAEECLIE